MSDFIPVLALGIIIFAVLLAMFSVTEIQPPYKLGFPVEEQIAKPESGWVGYGSEQISHISLGRDFSVSYESKEITPAVFRNETVKSGFFENKELVRQFEIENSEDVESAKIRLNVHDTNLYGKLVIFLNDEVIFNNYLLPGKYEIDLNVSKLGRTNVVRISAQNSGWKIWAPTTYILDADVIINYFSSKPKTFNFKGVKRLTMARFVASFDKVEGDGNFIVRVNDKEIYRGRPKRLLIEDISEGLKENNKIELLADRNSSYHIKDAEILLFYSPELQTKSVYYNLTESKYDMINGANLTFYIKAISGDVVGLLVKVTNSKGAHRIVLQDILRENKYYSINITKDELAPGTNRIELISSGNGGFLITNITVRGV